MLAVVAMLHTGLLGCVVVAAPPPRVVTLEEALAAADAVPEVIAARASERGADAGIRDAKAPGDPSLSLATKSVTARESVSVSVPFRWGGQKAAAVSQARTERDAAARRREAAVASARRACRIAWFTLAAGEDGLRAATALVDRFERNRRAVAELLAVARASRLDAARAETEAAMAKASLASAEHVVTAASAQLRALLGIDGVALAAGASRPRPAAEGLLPEWKERARHGSPDVAVAEAELKAAEARVALRARESRPLTSLDAGADWNDPTQPGTDVSLGLGITFPTHGRAAVDLARADRDRAAALLDLAQRRVDADVEAAWSAAGAARTRFATLDEVARPAAAEAAELTRLAYDAGKLDLFHLLDAERALAAAERDHAESYRDWGIAFAELERLAPEAQP